MYEKSCASTKFVEWDSIDFEKAEYEIKKLQMRIAKAVQQNRYNKVKALQWLLTHSFYAKAYAVNKAAQGKYKDIPGIDGISYDTSKKKLEAVRHLKRRGYVSQPLIRINVRDKNSKKQIIELPVMKDRSMRILYDMSVEPVITSKCQGLSGSLSKDNSKAWILQLKVDYIDDCAKFYRLFDNMCMDRIILNKFSKNELCKKRVKLERLMLNQINPSIYDAALDRIGYVLFDRLSNQRTCVCSNGYVREKKEFFIFGNSKQTLQDKVLPIVKACMSEYGIELNDRNVIITDTYKGIDIGRHHISKKRNRIVIEISQSAQNDFLKRCKGIVRANKTARQRTLINKLNLLIEDFLFSCNSCNSTNKGLRDIDYKIFEMLWRWACRRHNHKNNHWIKQKYFHKINDYKCCFSEKISSEKYITLLYVSHS